MNDKLFSNFNSVSAKEWKQKIQFELEGADYNKTLVWNSNEDISVKPFYLAEDFINSNEPIVSNSNLWKICQTIYVANVEKSNLKALNAIENGTDSILFIIPNENLKIEDLIKNINLDTVQIHLKLDFHSKIFIEKLSSVINLSKITIHNDVIEHLSRTGNFYNNLKEDFNISKSFIKYTNSLSVDGILYQNSGANIVQQLSYILASTTEHLTHYSDSLNGDLKVSFNIAVGSNYFFEIAKIRALRLLWATLAREYKINTNCKIITTPSKRNKTLYDNNTNMLRTTTEYMSAILGGADTVVCMPYDAAFHKPNKFGDRIARNQLLILKHESHFDKIINPVDGSYYIENLTIQLAEKALSLFKDIEKNGGFLKQLKEGIIQRKVKESASKEQQQLDNGELMLLGTNKQIDLNNKMKNELEIYPFIKTNNRKTLIEPILEKRLSETIEKERLKNEK